MAREGILVVMKVNIWGLNYWPEPVGIGPYSGELGEYLCDQGNEVTVVTTFPYYPNWEKRSVDEGVLFRADEIGGVQVNRCWHFVPKQPSFVTRLLYELSFIAVSTYRQFRLPKPDVYIVIAPPLLLGLAALLVGWLRGVPYIMHCQDLQLDAAVGLGVLRLSAIKNVLALLERFIYKHAARVSAITSQMCDSLVSKGVPTDKVVLFPNWVEVPEEGSLPSRGSWKERRGLSSETPLISYSGVLAFRQGMHKVIEAARLLDGTCPAVFVIAGNGPERSALEVAASELQLKNLLFEDVLSADEHTALLVDSEVCLVPQKNGTGSSSFPSKLLKTIALGRPVLTNAHADSTLHHFVKRGGFGLTVDSTDSTEFAEALRALLSDVEMREQMKVNGRKFAGHFNKSTVLERFVNVVSAVANTRSASSQLSETRACSQDSCRNYSGARLVDARRREC